MNWIPALSSTALLAIIGFLLSVPYRKAVETSIAAAFNTKLEATKAEFRRDEERLRADLRARDAELEALRSGALSSLAARHAEMSKRRIVAVERIWAHVTEITHLKMLSKFAETLQMNEMLESAERGGEEQKKMQEFAEVLLKAANANEPKPYDNSADKERPFISEITWALFMAYRQLLAGPIAQLYLIKTGASKSILADPSQMAAVLKNALPHQTAFIDEHGANGFPFLVDELERTLLRSLQNSLTQSEADNDAVTQAAKIMESVAIVAKNRDAGLPKFNLPLE